MQASRDSAPLRYGTDLAPVITLTSLVKNFGSGDNRVRAVNDVNVTVQAGEVVALLGPNGAGKTTTLDMLLGLTEPDQGSAQVFGMQPREAVRHGRIAAVLQTGGLLGDITVRETLEIIAHLHGVPERIHEVMDRTGVTPLAARRVGKCSGGEQQRVKFALALLPDPDIIVLDEPTAGMDVTARRQFWEVMYEDAAAGRTIIFATHYLEEAEQFARRTVVMHRGSVVADADTAKLRASLGGRTVTASPAPGATPEHLLSAVQAAPPIVTDPQSRAWLEGARIHVRTAQSDALAAWLLAHGATDLEIAAPTLASAFTSLTKD